ncbi:MAG: hypothetical protein J6Y60_11380 [Treponema sp.]|nr:hypothetical protein [Treponema sp.]
MKKQFVRVKFFCLFLLSFIFLSCSAARKFNGIWVSCDDSIGIKTKIEMSKDDKVVISYFPMEWFLNSEEGFDLKTIPESKSGYIDRDNWKIIINDEGQDTVYNVTFISKEAMSIKYEDGSVGEFVRENQPANLEIIFYYNPVTYTEFRSEESIRNGSYEQKEILLYRDLHEFTDVDKVLNEKPVYVKDLEKEQFYKSLIECLCIIKSDGKELMNFTYSENTNQEYALYNGSLIKRNENYDTFSKEVIRLIKSDYGKMKNG